MSLVEAVGGEPFSLTVGCMQIELFTVLALESVNHFEPLFHHITHLNLNVVEPSVRCFAYQAMCVNGFMIVRADLCGRVRVE